MHGKPSRKVSNILKMHAWITPKHCISKCVKIERNFVYREVVMDTIWCEMCTETKYVEAQRT